MYIRYCYLSSNFMKRVQKLPFYDASVEMEETTHILDFVTSFVDTYGDVAYDSLPGLLKCTQAKEIPNLPHDLSSWTSWIEQSYIPKEPSMLSPGAMSNAPDRLDGFHTFDALSSYEFYRHGLISKPIPGNNEIEDFLAHGLTDMWTYYCTGQFYEVSNRFMSMPSARNRIYGVQLFKYDIIGILHWGYNFYNSQFSINRINPYQVTDADNAFPSGDPFLVYPGDDRKPEESIRMMVHYEALTDLRAFELLESLISKEHVMELIEGELDEPLTFKRYPKSDMYLLTLRNRVNREIACLT